MLDIQGPTIDQGEETTLMHCTWSVTFASHSDLCEQVTCKKGKNNFQLISKPILHLWHIHLNMVHAKSLWHKPSLSFILQINLASGSGDPLPLVLRHLNVLIENNMTHTCCTYKVYQIKRHQRKFGTLELPTHHGSPRNPLSLSQYGIFHLTVGCYFVNNGEHVKRCHTYLFTSCIYGHAQPIFSFAITSVSAVAADDEDDVLGWWWR